MTGNMVLLLHNTTTTATFFDFVEFMFQSDEINQNYKARCPLVFHTNTVANSQAIIASWAGAHDHQKRSTLVYERHHITLSPQGWQDGVAPGHYDYDCNSR